MIATYKIDREKYGLPAGADDPAYEAQKWPLSKCLQHCQEATRAFGPHVADLFLTGIGDDQLARIAAGGYLSSLVLAASEYDLIAAFKRMAHDGKLRRASRTGTGPVFEDTLEGRALADTSTEGVEMYYAGQPDVVAKLWWAMLCENSAPFARLHGSIAGALQRKKQ